MTPMRRLRSVQVAVQAVRAAAPRAAGCTSATTTALPTASTHWTGARSVRRRIVENSDARRAGSRAVRIAGAPDTMVRPAGPVVETRSGERRCVDPGWTGSTWRVFHIALRSCFPGKNTPCNQGVLLSTSTNEFVE